MEQMRNRPSARRHLVLVALAASVLLGAGAAGAANTALKDVMKQMGVNATGDDAKALAPLFTKTTEMKPNDPDFAGWNAISDKGKAAADKGDLAAAKATCKECHTQFRDKFKTKYGSKAP